MSILLNRKLFDPLIPSNEYTNPDSVYALIVCKHIYRNANSYANWSDLSQGERNSSKWPGMEILR